MSNEHEKVVNDDIEDKIERLTEKDIYKDALIAFVLTKASRQNGGHLEYYIPIPYPIILGWEGILDEEQDLDEIVGTKQEIIGLIPMIESYAVRGANPFGDNPLFLGFEFKGAYHPDWLKDLKEQLRVMYLKERKIK